MSLAGFCAEFLCSPILKAAVMIGAVPSSWPVAEAAYNAIECSRFRLSSKLSGKPLSLMLNLLDSTSKVRIFV